MLPVVPFSQQAAYFSGSATDGLQRWGASLAMTVVLSKVCVSLALLGALCHAMSCHVMPCRAAPCMVVVWGRSGQGLMWCGAVCCAALCCAVRCCVAGLV